MTKGTSRMKQNITQKWFLQLGLVMAFLPFGAFAETATITVPANQNKTLDEAIAAGYMTGVADYAGLLAASDLVVDGPGCLIIDQDLKSAGYAGEVHVSAGSTLRLTASGSLGDTSHGTFVADGATLETFTDGAANTLSFLGEPLSFAGRGINGEGALVSLSAANSQRKGVWGGTVLTMTGDAMVRVKGKQHNMDFPYQTAHNSSSLDMNGHTLTFCGSGNNIYTFPVRMKIAHPGHIVVSNGLNVSVNYDNSWGGDTNNTFTIGRNARIDFNTATNVGAKAWSFMVNSDAMRNAICSTAGGGVYDGPFRSSLADGAGHLIPIAARAGEDAPLMSFRGSWISETGLEISNSTKATEVGAPRPKLEFTANGNAIGGALCAIDMDEVSFVEPRPSVPSMELVNAKISVNRHGIAGLWKGTNQAYASWNELKSDFTGNYSPSAKIPSGWSYYTNSVVYGVDDAMEATKPMYGKPTLVTYSGYIWNNSGKTQRITFLTHVNAYFRIAILREDGTTWNGLAKTDVNASGGPTAVLLTAGPHKIAIALALNNGNGGVNAALSGDYGIMYHIGDDASSSTDPADYQPLLDSGDGSLFTRMIPDSGEYEALGIYGTEPVALTGAVTGYGDSVLSLGGGNYSVGAVTGAVTIVNKAKPHTENAEFSITDVLACHAADLLIGKHLVVTGALKFAEGSILSIPDARTLPKSGVYTIAESSEAIVGMPEPDPNQQHATMQVSVSPTDGTKLLARIFVNGLIMIIR